MDAVEHLIVKTVIEAVDKIYSYSIDKNIVSLQKTNKDFEGDITLVVFPLLKISKKSPEITATSIGEYLCSNLQEVEKFNIVKGFLNISLKKSHWINAFKAESKKEYSRKYTIRETYTDTDRPYVIEYSSPNTNKPLHLGHIRNNLLGWSVSEIIKNTGKKVVKVNLVNDRGIHICKSMLAWQLYSNGETPQSSGMKGDHFVGKYYVIFSQKLSEQTKAIMEAEKIEKDEAENKTSLMEQAREMLRKWEAGDKETIELWTRMNQWVYSGFDQTYKSLGVDFDKIYYESQTYLLGKDIVKTGLEKGVLKQREDGSIWADLTDEGLDEKLLLRKDGTAVYMTQDLGTATLRNQEWNAERLIYVVGNEQNYHFDVLKRVLKKLGYEWGEKIVHLSYGMVELPEGKMKSREGTVVDADELIEQMTDTARQTTESLGKASQLPNNQEREKLYYQLAMGALKYFLLKVDPTKNMLFNPKESIDFNGNTGPFIQYTHARIRSLSRKFYEISGTAMPSEEPLLDFNADAVDLSEKESSLIQRLLFFRETVEQAADQYSPAIIANYTFDLAKDFNGFYQDTPILKEENENSRIFRLALAQHTGKIIKKCLYLIGIDAPERM